MRRVTAQIPPRASKYSDSSESGRISLLTLGLVLLVVAFVLTSMGVTTIHVQRRQLLACADAIALSVSGRVSATDYYEEDELGPSSKDVRAEALSVFHDLETSSCRVGVRRKITGVRVEDQKAVVEMRMTPKMPVFGQVLDFMNQPLTFSVASTATMH